VVKHSAFSMIELIFAIVIIAISVLSLPMMTAITSKNIEGSIVQEAIFAASTELNQAISYAWDENSIENGTSFSRVLWSATDCDSISKRRSGHIFQPYHRRCTDANTTTRLVLGSNGVNDSNDLDDINTTTHPIFLGIGSTSGYKKAYDSNISVTYTGFGTILASEQNIKKLTVSVSDPITNNPITVLHTFSSNIGGIDYYKKAY